MDFCIIGHHRSGTNALTESLGVVLNKKFFNEPFNRDSYKWGHNLPKQDLSLACEGTFVKTLILYDYNDDPEDIISCVKNMNMLFIYRDSVFDTAISLYTADYTSVWNIHDIHVMRENGIMYPDMTKGASIIESKFFYYLKFAEKIISVTKEYAAKYESLLNKVIAFDDLYGPYITPETISKIETVVGQKINKDEFVKELSRHRINSVEIYKQYKNFEEIYNKYAGY